MRSSGVQIIELPVECSDNLDPDQLNNIQPRKIDVILDKNAVSVGYSICPGICLRTAHFRVKGISRELSMHTCISVGYKLGLGIIARL